MDTGLYLQLVLGACNSANDAPARKASSDLADESRDMMKLNTPTAWKTILYLKV